MAFDCFAFIDGARGESDDAMHRGWIEVLSFSHRLAQPASGSASTGGGRSRERCEHGDFVIEKAMDKTSTKLAEWCCKGATIPEIKIEVCRATGDKQKYAEIVLSDSIVSEFQMTGADQGEGALPIEVVSFNYGKIEWKYIETDHNTGAPLGSVDAGWDRVTNDVV